MKKQILGLICFVPLFVQAGGFQVNLQGTKQTGMGHLGTSFYLGASSAYFNPAMMDFSSNKFTVEAGVSLISSSVAFQNQENGIVERTDNPLSTPFYLYATYKINDAFSAGIAVYTPFGSTAKWGDDWSGRYLIQDISLQAIYVQPTISYKINDQLRIGAGFVYTNGSVEINRAIPAPFGNNNQVNLKGSTNAYGFNAGVHYQVNDKISVGLSYRSEVEMNLNEGDAKFTMDPALKSEFPNTKFSAILPLPATATIGIAYKASEKLLLSVEGSFVQWSTYQSLDFDFKDNTSSLKDSENPRKYKDAMILRAGAQYTVNEKLDLRIGAYYDESPVQDNYFTPETPSTDNLGLTAGLSYKIINKLSIDAAFLYIHGIERESTYARDDFGGKYKVVSYIPTFGLTYNL